MAQLAASPRFVPYSTMVDLRRKAEEEQARKEQQASDLELRLGLSSAGNKTNRGRLSMSTVVEEAKQAQAMQRAKDRERKEKELLSTTRATATPTQVVPLPYSNMMIPYWSPAVAACHGLMFPFLPVNGVAQNIADVAEQGESSSLHGSTDSVVSNDHQSGSINDRETRHSNKKGKRKEKAIPIADPEPDLTLKLETSSASPEPNDSSALPTMPCVSTTGDGPDGKTITGVLYRYDNGSQVSIVCACHGTKLTPSEFVKHAGGTLVEHPLRQIVVVNS